MSIYELKNHSIQWYDICLSIWVIDIPSARKDSVNSAWRKFRERWLRRITRESDIKTRGCYRGSQQRERQCLTFHSYGNFNFNFPSLRCSVLSIYIYAYIFGVVFDASFSCIDPDINRKVEAPLVATLLDDEGGRRRSESTSATAPRSMNSGQREQRDGS